MKTNSLLLMLSIFFSYHEEISLHAYSTPSMSFVSNDSVNRFLVEVMGASLVYLSIDAEIPFSCDLRIA